MNTLTKNKHVSKLIRFAMPAVLGTAVVFGMVEPSSRTFTAGEKVKVDGVIVSRDGDVIKLRADDNSVGTVDLTSDTKIQMKHGVIFRHKAAMDTSSLLPGLHIEAQGKGNEKGELVADRVTFDPNSMRASRQIDTRVSPLEARARALEGRAGQMEGRQGQMEGRQGQLEGQQTKLATQQQQTEQQVGQVKTEADQATQGVTNTNERISNLDNYGEKTKETVYFRVNSSKLSDDDMKKLDSLAQEANNEKGYVIEVAGYADKTGKAALNQTLSEARANSVIRYLEQQGNIPIHRILRPAGMGTTHEAADNSSSQGRAMNRRVEVRVLVNQGVVAGSAPGSGATAPAPKRPGEKNQ